MDKLLEIFDLVVKADKNIVLDIPELTIYKGEVLVLLGPNGAGKSTLLYIAGGLKKPFSGKVQFSEAPALKDLEYRRKISTVFQTSLLLSESVESNVACGLKFRNVDRKEISSRSRRWMDLLHISHLAKRQAKTLSGGEAQRVSLARAFCLETELILMDEPFSALDTPTRQELLADLRYIFSKTNQTCIYVTHDLEEALMIGDRIAVLINGRLLQISNTQNVFDHPATPEVAAFMGVENIVPGTVVESENDVLRIRVKDALIEAGGSYAIGTQVFVCLRPEDVTLYVADGEQKLSTARNRLLCQITGLVNQGPFIRVLLSAGFTLTALITRPSASELGLQVGKMVYAVFKATAIHLILTGKVKQEGSTE